MFGWFKKKKDNPPAEQPKKEDKSQDMWARIVALQQQYWTPNPTELAQLYIGFSKNELSIAQLFRFHHLVCMEVLQEIRYAVSESGFEYQGQYAEVLKQTTDLLLSPNSPFRILHGSFWLNDNNSDQPSRQARFTNMSLTHLGAVELIRVDANQLPVELVFVPLDSIKSLEIIGSGLVKGCRLTHEISNKQEVYWMPLLYGQSHRSPDANDVSGNMTRFVGQLFIPSQGVYFGIGLGQQDLGLLGEQKQFSLMGWRHVKVLVTTLEITDPNFDDKCRGRGVDPQEIRKKMNLE